MIVVDKKGQETLIALFDLIYKAYGIKARELVEPILPTINLKDNIESILKSVEVEELNPKTPEEKPKTSETNE